MIIGKDVLDAGCGSGNLYKYVKDKNYTGVDFTKKFIEHTKALYPNAVFLTGNILDLPFPDNSFDTVACLSVLEHIKYKDLKQAINELIRTSRKLVLIEFCIPPWTKKTYTSNKFGLICNKYNKEEIQTIIKNNPRYKTLSVEEIPLHHVIYKIMLEDEE